MSGNGSKKNVLKIEKRIQLYEYLKGQKANIEREELRPEKVAKDAKILLGFPVTEYNVRNLGKEIGIRWANARTTPAPVLYGEADFETLAHAVGYLYQDLGIEMPGTYKELVHRILTSPLPGQLPEPQKDEAPVTA